MTLTIDAYGEMHNTNGMPVRKPFDIESALNGASVNTTDGRYKVAKVSFDLSENIMLVFLYNDNESYWGFYDHKGLCLNEKPEYTLVMAPCRQIWYMNVFMGEGVGNIQSTVYMDQLAAKEVAKNNSDKKYYKIAHPIEIEL